jgi:hypothetical protein
MRNAADTVCVYGLPSTLLHARISMEFRRGPLTLGMRIDNK